MKRLLLFGILAPILMVMVAVGAFAANIRIQCPQEGPGKTGNRPSAIPTAYDRLRQVAASCEYVIEGTITKGDYNKFMVLLKQRNFNINYVELDSPGGDLEEALRISDAIQRAFLNTSVYVDQRSDPLNPAVWRYGQCASACFIVWVSGAYRNNSALHLYADDALSPFILHRPYFAADRYKSNDARSLADDTARLVSVVRDYLSKNGVPQRIIDEMMKRSSVDGYRLTQKEADEIGGSAAWNTEWNLARCGPNPAGWNKNDSLTVEETIKRGERMLSDPRFSAWNDCLHKSVTEARRSYLFSLK